MQTKPLLVDRDRHLSLSSDEQVLAKGRATEMLLDVGIFSMAMHIFVTWLVVFVLWPVGEPAQLVVWAVVLTSILVVQAVLIQRFGGRALSDSQLRTVETNYGIAAAGVGVSWGICSGFFFPSGDLGRALFLVFVVGGMAMSAVATQHVKLRLCIIQITTGMAPLGISYAMSNLQFRELSGLLLTTYLAVLISLAIRQSRFAHKAINLQIVQERLLEELSVQAEELEIARMEAEEANASKSRFLAQSSHDLRQPLHAMSLFVESLPNLKGTEQYDIVLNKIRQSLDILTKLFDSLLDVTMLDTGGIKVNQKIFPLQDIMDQVVSDFGLVADASDVEITQLPTRVAVKSDPVLLTRMIQNLVSNAIHHAPGKRMIIGCLRRNGKISLVVADNGSGINEEDQQRIFSEFERLDAARMGDTAIPGLGLGLSIVRRVAKAMDLEIKLKSNPNRITRFEIAGLEIADQAEIKYVKHVPAKENLLDQLNVFILDDNLETLEATGLLLERWGCHVVTAQSLAGFPDEKPDLMLCDYEIGTGHTGLDVLRMLEERHQAKIPAVVISGHGSRAFRDEVAEQGLALLQKPLRPAPLRSALLNAITTSAETL